MSYILAFLVIPKPLDFLYLGIGILRELVLASVAEGLISLALPEQRKG
jgi:hypothetical protein